MEKSDGAQQTSTQSKDTKARPQRIYIQRIQNVSLCNKVNQLCRAVNNITIFTNADQCIDFLTNICTEKVCMFISGSLCQTIVPLIHDIKQLHTIFIFCTDQARYEQWSKIQSVCTETFLDIISKMGFFTDYHGQGMSKTDSDLAEILFIHPTKSITPFASIVDVGFYGDKDLRVLTDCIREETFPEEEEEWHRSGLLLIKVDEPVKAQQVFKTSLDKAKNNQEDYKKAITTKNHLKFTKKTLSLTDQTLTNYYNNIDITYFNMDGYPKAIHLTKTHFKFNNLIRVLLITILVWYIKTWVIILIFKLIQRTLTVRI